MSVTSVIVVSSGTPVFKKRQMHKKSCLTSLSTTKKLAKRKTGAHWSVLHGDCTIVKITKITTYYLVDITLVAVYNWAEAVRARCFSRKVERKPNEVSGKCS